MLVLANSTIEPLIDTQSRVMLQYAGPDLIRNDTWGSVSGFGLTNLSRSSEHELKDGGFTMMHSNLVGLKRQNYWLLSRLKARHCQLAYSTDVLFRNVT